MQNEVFKNNDEPFNFCKIIAGSEGTLLFITEVKLRTIDLPPRHKVLVCAHFNSIHESLEANLIGLKYKPSASELMDHYVLECTKHNIDQQKNRFFVLGDPKAVLVVEYGDDDPEIARQKAKSFISDLQEKGMGYHYPVVEGDDISKVWTLRKAGLGLLSNIPGDAKPVPVIEDTAVDVNDLPAYIDEFNEILKKYDLYCVHYAHAGSGELHLRPIINLKTSEGQKLFRVILQEIATLVKKYSGSLSGEHGDGRLRGEFIRQMIGEDNYQLLRQIKYTWDPDNIFNPGKIVDTPPMDTSLRYEKDQDIPEIDTFFDFSKEKGVLRAAELCNGSGDCRKTHLSGGIMCPSYMATKDEKDTTRARANTLREFLTHSDKTNRFDHKEIKEAMDLCLSCKGCKSECPSNVDMARLKAEFMQHYHEANGIPFRDKLFASFAQSNRLASRLPFAYNLITQTGGLSSIFKSISGIAAQRSIPKLSKQTLQKWFDKNRATINPLKPKRRVYFFADEFTNYNDSDIGIKAIKLLIRLGYEVIIPEHTESGRSAISKGFLKKARAIARENIQVLSDLISDEHPLIGTEPSAILSFRDEYPALVGDDLAQKANDLAKNCLLIEEFLEKEIKAGNIKRESFNKESRKIKLHGHCHQKALASLTPTRKVLEFPENYKVELIPSGCCGMAGSFGYEKEHYEVSMNIGELVLFPAVRNTEKETIIAAPGTSCRHQIMDGTGRIAKHPVEILYDALNK
jgi:Fe-S oxidoreductase